MQITKAAWININELAHYVGHERVLDDEMMHTAGLIVKSVSLLHLDLFHTFVQLKIPCKIWMKIARMQETQQITPTASGFINENVTDEHNTVPISVFSHPSEVKWFPFS